MPAISVEIKKSSKGLKTLAWRQFRLPEIDNTWKTARSLWSRMVEKVGEEEGLGACALKKL